MYSVKATWSQSAVLQDDEGDMRLRDKMTLWANPASLQWTVGRADVINADKTTSVCHIQIHIPLRGFTKVASVAR